MGPRRGTPSLAYHVRTTSLQLHGTRLFIPTLVPKALEEELSHVIHGKWTIMYIKLLDLDRTNLEKEGGGGASLDLDHAVIMRWIMTALLLAYLLE